VWLWPLGSAKSKVALLHRSRSIVRVRIVVDLLEFSWQTMVRYLGGAPPAPYIYNPIDNGHRPSSSILTTSWIVAPAPPPSEAATRP
jgi:hypothetical protein